MPESQQLETSADEASGAEHEHASEATVPGHRGRTKRRHSLESSVALPAESIRRRLERLERQNRWLRLGFLVLVLVVAYVVSDRLNLENAIVKQTLVESKELKLLDNDGNPRLFVRMYSRVPVMQVFDGTGKPRMSLGLRFDDTPFIDLSDARGRTRATFEMTPNDAPAVRLMDENGKTTFQIN